MSAPQLLVAEGHYVSVALAEGGYPLQSAFGLRQHSDWTVSIDCVSVIGKVPAAAFAGGALGNVRVHGWFRRKAVRALQRKRR